MIKFFRSRIAYLTVIFAATTLISVWFSKGMIIGAGESGLPFHNFSRLFPRTLNAWTDALMGGPSNHASLLFLGFITILSRLHIPLFLIQALFYWLMLNIAGLSLYHLAFNFFPNRAAATTSALFYILNLFTQVSVINRLQYPFLFFYAFLPLGLSVFIAGLRQHRLSKALLFSLISLPFSLSFASFPFLEVLWLTLGSYFLFHLFRNYRTDFKFSCVYFGMSLISWILLHLWWFGPLLSSTFATAYPTSVAVTQSGNIHSFKVLSRLVGGLPSVLSLSDSSFWRAITPVWGNFYTTFWGKILAILPATLVISTMFLKDRPVLWRYFYGLFLVSVFFAKGAAPPLGEISIFLISRLRFLEVFRNAFEKIGFVVSLSQAVLIGLALTHLLARLSFRPKYQQLTAALLGYLAIFVVTVYPMWTGNVFKSSSYPNFRDEVRDYVQVPDYYAQVNAWFKTQGSVSRLAVFPLSGEGITYSWPYGYNGVELSNELFDIPSISLTTSVPYLSTITSTLEETNSGNLPKFAQLLSKLSVSHLVVRNDVMYLERQLRNPQAIAASLGSSSLFTKAASFGLQDIYIPSLPPHNLVNASTNVVASYPQPSFNDYHSADIDPAISIISLFDIQSTSIPHRLLIKPKRDFLLPPDTGRNLEDSLSSLPATRFLPNHPLYPLIKVKEFLLRLPLARSSLERFQYDLMLLGKRLVEIHDLLSQNDKDPVRLSAPVFSYRNLFSRVFLSPDNMSQTKSLPSTHLIQLMWSHLTVMRELAKKYPHSSYIITPLLEYVSSSLSQVGLNSMFAPSAQAASSPRRVIHYEIPQKGSYLLQLSNEGLFSFYEFPDNSLSFQLDNQYTTAPLVATSAIITLGEHELTPGLHEVVIPLPPAKNILQKSPDFVLTSSQPSPKIPLLGFQSDTQYIIKMDYMFQKGDRFELRFVQDVDKDSPDPELTGFMRFNILKDNYDHSWRNFEIDVSSYPTASSAYIQLVAPHFNNCQQNLTLLTLFSNKCQNLNFKKKYDKPSILSIRNLRMEKKFSANAFLSSTSTPQVSPPPQIHYQKTSPTRYLVDIQNSQSPFILSLSQIFHPGWQAYQETLPSRPLPHFLADGYANGWFVPSSGNLDIILEFRPQKLLRTSQIVSGAALPITIVVYLLLRKRVSFQN